LGNSVLTPFTPCNVTFSFPLLCGGRREDPLGYNSDFLFPSPGPCSCCPHVRFFSLPPLVVQDSEGAPHPNWDMICFFKGHFSHPPFPPSSFSFDPRPISPSWAQHPFFSFPSGCPWELKEESDAAALGLVRRPGGQVPVPFFLFCFCHPFPLSASGSCDRGRWVLPSWFFGPFPDPFLSFFTGMRDEVILF